MNDVSVVNNCDCEVLSMGRVKVTKESDTGRNTKFLDTRTGETMTRTQFVKAIESGKYEDYHVRVMEGVKTPAANPDGKSSNNLG